MLGAADSLPTMSAWSWIRVEGSSFETTRGHRARQRDHRRAEPLVARCTRVADQPRQRAGRVRAGPGGQRRQSGALLRYREAEALLRGCSPRGRTIRPRSLACAGSHQLGAALAAGGERQAAIGSLEAGLSVLGRVEARIEASPDLQLEVANAEMMLALLLADQNGMTEAVAHGNRASTIAGDLSRDATRTTGGIACCRSQRATPKPSCCSNRQARRCARDLRRGRRPPDRGCGAQTRHAA